MRNLITDIAGVRVGHAEDRKIGSGASLTVDRDNDKNPVVALREIAVESIPLDTLKEDLVRNHQRMVVYEEDETIDLMDGEAEWEKIATVVTEGLAQVEGLQRTQTLVAFRVYSAQDLESAFDMFE